MRSPAVSLWLALLGLAALAAPAGATPPPEADGLSLERLHADPPLAGRLPRQATLAPAGGWLAWLQPEPGQPDELALWGQALPAGRPARLLGAADLLGAAPATLTEAERMALQRRRVAGHGIVQYAWCGEAGAARLLLPLGGGLHSVTLGPQGVQRHQPLLPPSDEPVREARCDRAGRQLAFVRGGDLWTLALDSAGPATPRRLTHRASPTRSIGLAEFIAEEELDRHEGYWWSPDGRRLLALEADERDVPVKVRAQISGTATAFVSQRYPGAGQPNARLRAWVVDARSGRLQPLTLPAGTEYVARAGWFADGTPWLQTLTRDQTRLRLVAYEGAAARPVTLVDEQDPAWVDLHDDLREWPGRTRAGRPALLWSSERSGRRQLWLADRAGGALQPLTALDEPVQRLVCASAERRVVEAATDRGRGRELFLVDADGQARPLPGAAPHQWRQAQADAGCRRLLVTRSAWGEPPRSEVLDLSGEAAPLPLHGEAPDPALPQWVPQPEPLPVHAADGHTPLNAFYFPPRAHRLDGPDGRHPVIVRAYGGPFGQDVAWRWSDDALGIAYWQRLGFGVMVLDTRGMAQRDRDFTHAHHRAFGQVEVADLFTAVRQLAALRPQVDARRIGFTGWSYGGYLAARALMDDDTPLAAAFAGAPPADWTLYDTAYTERYLGVAPQGADAATYARASLLGRAAQLKRPLMVAHGTADDNVLFENTLRLAEALQQAGPLFELMIYPGQAHGISGQALKLHLDRTETDFFLRRLAP